MDVICGPPFKCTSLSFMRSNLYGSAPNSIGLIYPRTCKRSMMAAPRETQTRVDEQGSRKFYDFQFVDENLHALLKSTAEEAEADTSQLRKYIHDHIIGSDYTFISPFGVRRVLYCDYIASGRSLTFIEDYIRTEVQPAYGNTHTTTSVTGLQSTLFRHEARTIIRDCTNASEHDCVLFFGNGCTGAVHKLIHGLTIRQDNPPIVFAGPFDHHSTLLPWREITRDVIQIPLNEFGLFDLESFKNQLEKYAGSGRQLIGCMAAASNITGNMLPVDDITILLHKAGALAFWDYATAAPYVELNMNPYIGGDDQPFIYKDAIFVSPHKFIGGPGTPGLLVAKKKLFSNPVPSFCGGGTVFFVRREHHNYLQDVESREEGGTPDIIGSIRAGLIFQLKRSVGVQAIVDHEKQLYHKAMFAWKGLPGLKILGNTSLERLPIFSMMFPVGNKYLHHNYAASLFDDVFGIQCRGGCACAGPYAEDLLGIHEQLAKQFEEELVEDSRLDRTHLRRTAEHSDKEIIRPGFVRLNLTYFMSELEVDFVIAAVKMVATHGWKLLPRYLFNPTTGEWKVRGHEVFEDRKWLGAISYEGGKMRYKHVTHDKSVVPNYQETLKLAEEIFKAADTPKGSSLADQTLLFSDTNLLWFVLPSEAQDLLQKKKHLPLIEKPVFKLASFEDLEPLDAEAIIDGQVVDQSNGERASKQTTDDYTKGIQQKPGSRVKDKWQNIPKQIMTPFIQAIEEHDMIQEGDRILICLSGGKDSLSLLHAMKQYQHRSRSKGLSFEMGAVTVDPGSDAYDPRPLIGYMEELGVPYFYEEQGIMRLAGSLPGGCDSICSFCSRMKRGRIYNCARMNGYNVLALGQHLDDLAESFMMSVFHNGLLRTMKANYTVREGDLRVIRPLVYVREKMLRDFAETRRLPIIAENCPACFEQPKERHRVKQLLASQEVMFPDLYGSLMSSLKPLMAIKTSDKLAVKNLLNPNTDSSSQSTAPPEDNDDDLGL